MKTHDHAIEDMAIGGLHAYSCQMNWPRKSMAKSVCHLYAADCGPGVPGPLFFCHSRSARRRCRRHIRSTIANRRPSLMSRSRIRQMRQCRCFPGIRWTSQNGAVLLGAAGGPMACGETRSKSPAAGGVAVIDFTELFHTGVEE